MKTRTKLITKSLLKALAIADSLFIPTIGIKFFVAILIKGIFDGTFLKKLNYRILKTLHHGSVLL